WNANTTGRNEDFGTKEQAQNALDAALSNPDRFLRLSRLEQVGLPLLPQDIGRQVQLLYLMYLEKQVNPGLMQRMVAKANAIEQTFNVYRATVEGKPVTD